MIKHYNDTGSLNDRPRAGRPRSARTPALKNKNKVHCRVIRNPRRSIRKMARDFSVNHETMRKLVTEDLGLKSFKRTKAHNLNDSIRAKRLERCKALLRRFAPGSEEQILFSDEKIFTVKEVTNSQTDKTLSKRSRDISEKIKYIDRAWPDHDSVVLEAG